jgi:methyl-accepting chemotaxis protein
MNWFKNLNATPRLMSSFGVLLVLTLGISYLAISNLSKANDRMDGLYQEQLKGSIAFDNIAIDKLDIARAARDGMLNNRDAAVVAADLKALRADFVDMSSNYQTLQQLVKSKEVKVQLKTVGETLPGYEKAAEDVAQAIGAGNVALASERLHDMADLAGQMSKAINQACDQNEANAEQTFQANEQAYQTARSLVISVVAIALLLGIILSIVIARGFSVPLGHAVMVLERIAEGDLTVRSDVQTKDEVGRMADALNRAVEKLDYALQEVAESAANASTSSQELASAAESIASGAQEQAASLEETSASLEEITAAVRQSADNANQASQLASSSKDSALQGQDVVMNAITAMSEINSASAKISDIISTIDEIAFQTNLLAVNAAVEAARAGDEGRGFAVVASEVRSLAQRSAVAAKEIKVLIQDSLKKVEAGSGLVNRSGETLQGIVGSVKRVTDIVGEIAAASGEQSTGIEQVNTAMTQMDQVTQSNSAQTEELSATAQSLSEQSAHLMDLVSTFTLTQGQGNARQRQSYQPHEANQHTVGANLVQSAKASMMNSGQQNSAAARSSKTAKMSAQSKQNSRSRGAKSQSAPPPQVMAAAVAAGPGGGDESFVEF